MTRMAAGVVAPLVALPSPQLAPVYINVGGTTYTSTLETLTKFPNSKLAQLFNGTLPIGVDPLKQRYFLDRDGKTFRHILNYVRNSKLTLPENYNELELLLEEAAFFEIEDLCQALTEKLNNKTDVETDSTTDANYSATDLENKLEVQKKRRRKKQGKKSGDVEKERKPPNKETTENEHLIEENAKSDESDQNPLEKELLKTSSEGSIWNNIVSTKHATLSSDVVYVLTDASGRVNTLWCSDENFTIDFPAERMFKIAKSGVDFYDFYRSTVFNISGRTRCWRCSQYCNQAFVTKQKKYGCELCDAKVGYEYEHLENTDHLHEPVVLGFPWTAKYLLKQGYKLINTFGINDESNHKVSEKVVLYHCFMN